MKSNLFLKLTAAAFGLAAVCIAGAVLLGAPATARAETLNLRLSPEQSKLIYGRPQEVVIKIDLDADKVKGGKRLPLNLAVVLDRSSSMSGAKIEKARQAAAALLDQLGSEDTFSLVAYDSSVEVLIPAQKLESKADIRAKIMRIQPGGSTALYAGVEEGGRQLQRYFESKNINRVILLSDGLANVGPSSTEDVRDLGRRLSRKSMSVSTIGLGDDYNEDLMTALAVASDANYYYVKDVEKLQSIFEKELGQLLSITARNIRIRIVLPKGVEPISLIGREEKFDTDKNSSDVEFAPFYSGQQRYIYLRCRMPANDSDATREVAKVQVSYDDELNSGKRVETEKVVSIAYTKDVAEADKSIDLNVQMGRELQDTAVAKQEAVRYSDAGDYQQANKILRENEKKVQILIDKSRASGGAVKPLQIVELEREEQNLNKAARGTTAAPMSSSQRKATMSEQYRQSQAK
ncbi:hypothetical protein DB346_16640 [Verrucomicrobia bacterium LW23]|nr:hypothetical protein DB346_16640 [Verrucomicrobia bacterium LW23]